MIAVLDQALGVLRNPTATANDLNAAAAAVRKIVRELDEESESGSARETQILAALVAPGGPSIDFGLKGLASLDDEFATRALIERLPWPSQRSLSIACARSKSLRLRKPGNGRPSRRTPPSPRVSARFSKATSLSDG